MKKICVLLNGAIKSDARVIKTITTISRYHKVDLFYLNGNDGDKALFNENVSLISIKYKKSLRTKIISHTNFYNEFVFLASSVLKNKKNYDYVWANDLTCLKPAVIVKKQLGCKLIYDSHEIYVETLNQFFPENSKGIKKILLSLSLKIMVKLGTAAEKKMIKSVDTCITVGICVKDYLENNLKTSGILVIYNCPYLQTSNEQFDLRKLLGLKQNEKILLYQGVMNQGRGLIEMIHSQKFTKSNIKFVLMGDGPMKLELQKLVENLNLQNKIFFIDRVDYNVLLKYTRGADAGIVLQDVNKNLSKKLGIANKFFEYMHAGIPFVATDAPENRIVYNEFELCTLVNPKHDINEIANAINGLFENDLELYRKNALAASKIYNWDRQEEIIKSIIN